MGNDERLHRNEHNPSCGVVFPLLEYGKRNIFTCF